MPRARHAQGNTLCTLRRLLSISNSKNRITGGRHSKWALAIASTVILVAPLVPRAADVPVIKPFLLDFDPPQVIQTGAEFPYLWLRRDGTALLEVSKGSRTYHGSPTFEYSQQDPLFLVSRDGLKTWEPWSEAAKIPLLPWFEGAEVELRDGSVLMFEYISNKVSSEHYEGRMWRSSAGWRTFEGPSPFHLSIPGFEEAGGSDQGKPFLAVPWHRSVIEMPDGSLLASIYGRFKEDRTPADYEPAMFRMRAITMASHDHGQNWSYVSTIASAPLEQEGFDEPVMVRLAHGAHQGRLVCLMRTGRVSPLYQSVSDDEGKTWSAAHPLSWMFSKFGRWRDLVGTDPDLIEMQDGTLVASFGHKRDFEDDGDFIAFSVDQGQSWTEVTRLSMERTCAYTSVVEIEPGVLYATYSAGGIGAPPAPVPGNPVPPYRVIGQRIHVRRP